MNKKIHLKHAEVIAQSMKLAHKIMKGYSEQTALNFYPVPRGGVPVAYTLLPLLMANFAECHIVDSPEEADFIVDDIVDSGRTREKYFDEFPGTGFFALIDKPTMRDTGADPADHWFVFPWENRDPRSDMEDTVIRLLEQIGEDPTREGLLETPRRVAKAYKTWFGGYAYDTEQDIAKVLKVFEDGADKYDEMVTVKRIPFYSMCEHHMAPIFGTLTIGYIPNGKIVGLSKLSRLANVFARRLQVQERMTTQIADTLMKHLEAKGVGVIVEARHLCMESRGIKEQGHSTITTALRGNMSQPAVRQEFLSYHNS